LTPRSRERSDAVRAASRARILQAAQALFAERGFSSCRIVDVARRAGMSPGNVYWHFDSKEAILGAVLAAGYADLVAMAESVAADYGPARRKLELLVDRTIELYDRNAAFATIATALESRAGGDKRHSLGIDPMDAEARCRAALRRVFSEARSEGALVATMDPDAAARLFLGLFDGLAAGPAQRRVSLPRGTLRDAALRVVGYRSAG
jgi:AcrR family transcriptional regulator